MKQTTPILILRFCVLIFVFGDGKERMFGWMKQTCLHRVGRNSSELFIIETFIQRDAVLQTGAQETADPYAVEVSRHETTCLWSFFLACMR